MKISARWAYWAAALLVVIVAAIQRLTGLSDFSLTLDESTLVEAAKGVLERGEPSLYVGSMLVLLATYELVPYFIAASLWLFGVSDFTLRLPSAIFGILTTYVVFYAGWRLFDWRTGLLAGLLYALSPWATHWAQNLFHPSQTQFFVLLTALMVRRLLQDDQVPVRTYYLAAFFFSCAYLSWEGSGFVLPILLIVAMIMRWREWEWLKNPHLWVASAIVTLVVVVQGVRRVLLQVDYLMVGSGKSDVSLPQFVFTKTTYSPYYYLWNFLSTEFHLVLTAVFVLSLGMALRHWNLRFFYLFTLLGIFFMTNFLGYYNAHYIYYLLPIFIIATSAGGIMLMDYLTAGYAHGLRTVRLARHSALVIFVALTLTFSVSQGLKFHNLGGEFRNPVRSDIRPEMAGIDYRNLSYALKEHYRPGDTVIALAPLALRHYAGIDGDYFLQTITDRKIIYDPGEAQPKYLDKYVGNPVIRTQQEFYEVLRHNRRVWVYATPYGGFKEIIEPELLDFLQRRLTTVSETFDGKLYLWER